MTTKGTGMTTTHHNTPLLKICIMRSSSHATLGSHRNDTPLKAARVGARRSSCSSYPR